MFYLFLKFLDKGIEKFSLYTLVVSLFGMLGLTVLSIIMRWFGQTAIWIDPFIRHLVFFSAFLGGVLATGARQHIGIDILSKYFEKMESKMPLIWQRRLLSYVSCATLIWLSFSSLEFIKINFEYEGIVFLGIHRGVLTSLIPFGFLLIAYRFFFLLVKSFVDENENLKVEG